MSDTRELICEASRLLFERKETAAPRWSDATPDRIGRLLVGTDLMPELVIQLVNEMLNFVEQRLGVDLDDTITYHLGDQLMDAFLTGVLYEQLRNKP